jgi:hypothetical protein
MTSTKTEDLMTRHLMFAMALTAPFLSQVPAQAGLTTLQEVTETMMQAQGDESSFLGAVLGAGPSTNLLFTSNVDPVTRSFSFDSVSGQTYLGMPFSLDLSGSFDPTRGQYAWSATGQLGSQSWTNAGIASWVGDPTATISDTYVYHSAGGNLNYAVTGTVQVDGTGDSSGNFTFAGPGGPFTYPGTDHLNSDGTWNWTVPNTPIGTVFGANGFVPFPMGGAGQFTMSIARGSVPEPSSLIVLISAIPLGLAYFRRRYTRVT